MASKIKVDQIEGSTGSSITIPTGQTLTITDGIAASTIGSGTLSSDRLPTVPVAKGGTGLTSLGTANQVVAVNSGATALEFQTVSSDIVKLAQNNSPTATNSFDGYFDGTKYKTYKIIIDSVHPNSGNTGNRIGFKFRRLIVQVTQQTKRKNITGKMVIE